MAVTEVTNMVMIRRKSDGKVLVQRRIKNWCGIAFPGGHAEPGETLYDSAVREVKEETGLDVRDLKACGFMCWYNNRTEDRYLVWFYRTENFSGSLLEGTEEGKVFWVCPEDLEAMDLAPNFREYLPVFLSDGYTEAFCSWNEETVPDKNSVNPWGVVYRRC